MNIKTKRSHNSSVIFERFTPGGLIIITHKRDISNLKPFAGTEESHVNGIIVERIYQYSFFENKVFQTCFFCLDATCQTDRSAAYNDDIKNIFFHGTRSYYNIFLQSFEVTVGVVRQ